MWAARGARRYVANALASQPQAHLGVPGLPTVSPPFPSLFCSSDVSVRMVRETPKSEMTARLSSAIKMLSGLRSKWTMSCE